MNVEGHQHGNCGQGDAPENAKELRRPTRPEDGGAMAPAREAAGSIGLSQAVLGVLLNQLHKLHNHMSDFDEERERLIGQLTNVEINRKQVRHEIEQIEADLKRL